MQKKSDYKSYIFTGNKLQCTGCGACAQICSHKALEMRRDSEGFLFPMLNEIKCVQCGLCDKTCPVTGSNAENTVEEQKCYVATTCEKIYYKESASIGICTMLSKHIVDSGGIVYGSFLDESNWSACHISVCDAKGVQKIRNSKYLQSSTGTTYTQVKENLSQGTLVLYIGTPCQIAGLKSFLRKQYPNLYTIDLVCHGVFSPLLMPLEVAYWEKTLGGKVKNFRFRSKRVYKHLNGGMVNFDLMSNGKTSHIERFAASSPSYRCYAYSGDGLNYNHRLSCYSCPFRSQSRYGDISVGDPWFITNDVIKNKLLNSSNSIRTLYVVNTDRGRKLISSISDKLIEEEISILDAFSQPALQKISKEIPSKREIIYSSVNSQNYGTLIEQLLQCNLTKEHKKLDRQYQKMRIKRFIKKLLMI